MKLILIGMSNVGKSFWSKKLSEKGYKVYRVDSYIAEKLGFRDGGATELATWMGPAGTPEHDEKEKIYLKHEKEAILFLINELEKAGESTDSVIDATGSIIYLDTETLKKLHQQTKFIYLETPDSVIEEMKQKFYANPKPLIWAGMFRPTVGESYEETIKRDYPLLLQFRKARYKAHADVTLDYHEVRKPDFTIDTFLDKVK